MAVRREKMRRKWNTRESENEWESIRENVLNDPVYARFLLHIMRCNKNCKFNGYFVRVQSTLRQYVHAYAKQINIHAYTQNQPI